MEDLNHHHRFYLFIALQMAEYLRWFQKLQVGEGLLIYSFPLFFYLYLFEELMLYLS